MPYIGDIRLNDTLDFKFCTVQATGAPTTLAGTPSVACYPGNSTTEITAGITLSVDFDSRTGLNNVRVVASGGNGYATATNYDVVITAGTVNSVSAVGYVVGSFSIENRSALMPTTATRTLDVASTGEAGLDYANVNVPTGAIKSLGMVDNGTASALPSSTSLTLASLSFGTNALAGRSMWVYSATAGAGEVVTITANTNATPSVVSFDAPTVSLSGTVVYVIFAAPSASTSNLLPVDVKAVNAVSASSVTTVNANLGTTQPVNFTGTGASALAKGDMVDIAGTASAGTAGYVGIDWAHVNAPTSTVGLSGTTVGTTSVATSVTALAGSAGIKKNTAKAAFAFPMTDSTNHAPATGLTVTAQRSLDGAAFANCTNAVSEISGGWYKLDLAAGDLNGNTVALKFTATGADQLNIALVTGP